ncbi:hypothetical protein [Rhizobium tropici]|nr:hypothetical protein [Rhizobium tropici]
MRISVVPFKEQWQRDIYREGLQRAGFWKPLPNSVQRSGDP